MGGCVLSTRRPKWNSRFGRTGRTGRPYENGSWAARERHVAQPVRLLTRCDKIWKYKRCCICTLYDAVTLTELVCLSGQAEDIDPRFPWPLQHGFREEFSIGGRVKPSETTEKQHETTESEPSIILYPRNPTDYDIYDYNILYIYDMTPRGYNHEEICS